MSALTKKHHTDDVAKISWHGGLYAVPIEVMERYKVTSDDKYISIDDLFSDLTQESGEPGMLLKGLRYREGLSQIDFAKKLNVSQTNLSAMENGRRAIGKELAKRIADLFEVDYRIFL
ncbi:helix-turn-helix protein [Legionella birminghamensis]|uniref:Helix-turn-helix protein n=2 Tax=Legionella TaxID=445 RepID=A0A378JU95_9GAMM|nr:MULTISPECIES: helix-turn-helix transcriptional regulator [Legionella]KTC71406.1 helix-turn-helix protein [Legionella birminghamensis]SEG47860.1 DNA-binding transcriptional regulator, XRE-family HTH domain [Legionella quinlivanii DSM 21216]STX60972.1 Predicted transcriptional regulator [Legionella birminghamensis]STY49772.1 Predicted transcriptional regulator [Legionella quinlivanii]